VEISYSVGICNEIDGMEIWLFKDNITAGHVSEQLLNWDIC
jgi:hypothetical protein